MEQVSSLYSATKKNLTDTSLFDVDAPSKIVRTVCVYVRYLFTSYSYSVLQTSTLFSLSRPNSNEMERVIMRDAQD